MNEKDMLMHELNKLVEEEKQLVESLKEAKTEELGGIRLQIYLTKTHKFRARIKEPGQVAYEVTLGGNSWKEGKGTAYANELFQLCAAYLQDLTMEFARVFNLSFEKGKTPVGLVKTNDEE